MTIPLSTFLLQSPLSILKEVAIKSVDDVKRFSSSHADDNYRATLAKIDKVSSILTTLTYIFSIAALIVTPALFGLGIITRTAAMSMMLCKIAFVTSMVLLNSFIDSKKTKVNHLYSQYFAQVNGPITHFKAWVKDMHAFEYVIFTAKE